MCVVGSDERLGGWEVGAAPRLAWREGHVWSAVVDVPADKPLEFKFVCCADWRPPIWEQVDNRCLTARWVLPCAAAAAAAGGATRACVPAARRQEPRRQTPAPRR